jgi:tRNA-2-methylthio-N6-dimethylallyladenosine synthase
MTKKLLMRTYGCQMNVYDSDRMADALTPLGYQTTENLEEADMVILNTCHIREKASEKVFSELGRLRDAREDRKKREGKSLLICVTGCVAQAEGDEILKRAPYVDIVLGPQTYHRLPQMVAEIERQRKLGHTRTKLLDTDFPTESKFDLLPEMQNPQGVVSFLTIQEGCDQFCTYCVVPYTRGAESSRPLEQVVAEAKKLVELGAREIILLGQNVNAYHGKNQRGEKSTLADLIREVVKIPELLRIRYTTSHPTDMRDDLIEIHATEPKLMPLLHLPVQSGSSSVLKGMNRKHTREEYIEVIEKMKRVCPQIAFSTDIIVGFPGETEEQFEETLSLVEYVGYTQAFCFKYSPRPGTPAALREDQIDEKVMSKRLERLQDLLKILQTTFNKNSLDKVETILLERKGRDKGIMLGKTPYMQWVQVEASDDLMGQEIKVAIEEAETFVLKGRLVQ